MITHKPQLWFSFNKPINPIYDILLQNPLLMKLDLWYMFVNALIHKTQLRYPFFRAIFTHKPNYGILFCKAPFTHKTQLWYTFCKAPFTHKTQLSYPANKLYWQIPIMLPYTWKWNPSLTKTQLWLEFSKAHLLLSQNPIPVSFCFSHYWHKPNYDILLPKPIYLQVHPITVLQSLTLQRFYYFKPKIERPVESEGNLHLCVKSSNFKTKVTD